ncbi:unnamed protein product [Amoebophrya sp. A25]|nr:unnamed protein product [Amoebophrya sp. A25]|eukprot:GSA25T00016284001.1
MSDQSSTKSDHATSLFVDPLCQSAQNRWNSPRRERTDKTLLAEKRGLLAGADEDVFLWPSRGLHHAGLRPLTYGRLRSHTKAGGHPLLVALLRDYGDLGTLQENEQNQRSHCVRVGFLVDNVGSGGSLKLTASGGGSAKQVPDVTLLLSAMLSLLLHDKESGSTARFQVCPIDAAAPEAEVRRQVETLFQCHCLVGVSGISVSSWAQSGNTSKSGTGGARGLPVYVLGPDDDAVGVVREVRNATGVTPEGSGIVERAASPASGSSGAAEYEIAGAGENFEITLLLATSGTTGERKLVGYTTAQLFRSARAIAGSLRLSFSDVCLNALPYSHIGGLCCNFLAVLVSGGSLVVLPGRFDSTEFLRYVFLDEDDTEAQASAKCRASEGGGKEQANPIDRPSTPGSRRTTFAAAYRVTWYYVVPTMHRALLLALQALCAERQHPDGRHQRKVDRERQKHLLRFVRSASANLRVEEQAALEEVLNDPSMRADVSALTRTQVLPTYGMTECMPICSPTLPRGVDNMHLDHTEEAGNTAPIGSVGQLCAPEVELKIVPAMEHVGASAQNEKSTSVLANHDPLPYGVVGEICVRGSQTARYFDIEASSGSRSGPTTMKPGASEVQALQWFRTGDLGTLDAGGNLFLRGRVREMLKRGGEQVALSEADGRLLDAAKEVLEEVQQSVVRGAFSFSVPSQMYDEELAGVVLVNDVRQLLASAWCGHVSETEAQIDLLTLVPGLRQLAQSVVAKNNEDAPDAGKIVQLFFASEEVLVSSGTLIRATGKLRRAGVADVLTAAAARFLVEWTARQSERALHAGTAAVPPGALSPTGSLVVGAPVRGYAPIQNANPHFGAIAAGPPVAASLQADESHARTMWSDRLAFCVWDKQGGTGQRILILARQELIQRRTPVLPDVWHIQLPTLLSLSPEPLGSMPATTAHSFAGGAPLNENLSSNYFATYSPHGVAGGNAMERQQRAYLSTTNNIGGTQPTAYTAGYVVPGIATATFAPMSALELASGELRHDRNAVNNTGDYPALTAMRFLLACWVIQLHCGRMPTEFLAKAQSLSIDMPAFTFLAGFLTAKSASARPITKYERRQFYISRLGVPHTLYLLALLFSLPSFFIRCPPGQCRQPEGQTGYGISLVLNFLVFTSGFLPSIFVLPFNPVTWYQANYYYFVVAFPYFQEWLASDSIRVDDFGLLFVWGGATLSATLVMVTLIFRGLYFLNFLFFSWVPLFLCAIASWLVHEKYLLPAVSHRRALRRRARDMPLSRQMINVAGTELLENGAPHDSPLRSSNSGLEGGQAQHMLGGSRGTQTGPADRQRHVHAWYANSILWALITDGISFLFIYLFWLQASSECSWLPPKKDVRKGGRMCFEGRTWEEYNAESNDPKKHDAGPWVSGRWNTETQFWWCACRLHTPFMVVWFLGLAGAGERSLTYRLLTLKDNFAARNLAPLAYPMYLLHYNVAWYYWYLTRGTEREWWWPEAAAYPWPVSWPLETLCVIVATAIAGAMANMASGRLSFLGLSCVSCQCAFFGDCWHALLGEAGSCCPRPPSGSDIYLSELQQQQQPLGAPGGDSSASLTPYVAADHTGASIPADHSGQVPDDLLPYFRGLAAMIRSMSGAVVGPASRIDEVGLDSFGVAAFAGILRHRFSEWTRGLRTSELVRCQTVQEVCVYLRSLSNAGQHRASREYRTVDAGILPE